MTRILSLIAALAISLIAGHSAADDGHLYPETSIAIVYALFGGTPSRSAPVQAPATGGVAFAPMLRLAYAHATVDPYVTATPIIVLGSPPYSLDSLGFVGAVDLGIAWHLENRAWSLGTGATAAPTYMRFCNGAPWCLREWTMLWGGEIHASGRISADDQERGVSWTIAGRVFHEAPTAYTWSRLTDEQANVARWSVMLGGLATYRW